MRLDVSHDVVSGADSDRDAIYIDKRIPQFSSRLTDRSGRPANLWKYLSLHEIYEARDMANGMGYDQAHLRATAKEHAAVVGDGVDWRRYEAEINGYLASIEHEKAANPPPPDQHVAPHRALRKQGHR
jgi:hypothetical protein